MAKVDKFWDSEKELGRVQKNDRGEFIVIKEVTKGKAEKLDVRTYYPDEISGELLPGKGISIPLDLADEVAMIIMGNTPDEEEEQDV